MAFKKWSSIENHYNNKAIARFQERFYGELKSERFLISEKIDGSNFSVIFNNKGGWQFAKRNSLISNDESFYNFKSAFESEEMGKFFFMVSSYCSEKNKTLQFVGELYGQGVQKRVYYGPDRYWRWYAIYDHITYDNVKNLSVKEMNELGDDIDSEYSYDIDYFRAHVYKTIYGLEEALEFDINKNSFYTPEGYDKENFMEGVVIRPFNNYYLGDDFLIIKKKNPKFDDKNVVKKERVKFNITEDLQSLYDKVIGYVNENRTEDLFSKYGMIDSVVQTGMYIKFYSQDIIEDIKEEYPLEFDNLGKKDRNWLMKQLVIEIKNEIREHL